MCLIVRNVVRQQNCTKCGATAELFEMLYDRRMNITLRGKLPLVYSKYVIGVLKNFERCSVSNIFKNILTSNGFIQKKKRFAL